MSATTTTTRGPARDLRVTEARTYTGPTGDSYFIDLLRPEIRHEADSIARLERHAREMEVDGRRFEARGNATTPELMAEFEYRAPSLAPGSGGYGTPPLWLPELTALAPRPERVVSDLIGSQLLPEGVSSVNVPRLTRGTNATQQVPNQPVADQDIADAFVESAVTTVSGDEDVPLQLLEQSPLGKGHLDQTIWRDLTSAYDAELEWLLLNGVGGAPPFGEPLGLLNVSGTGSVTYTSSTPTAMGLYPYLGQLFGSVSDNRKVRPEGFLLRGGRWAWLASSEDSSDRPFETPSVCFAMIQNPTLPNPIGGLLGLPVHTSEEIPTNLGAGEDQDTVIAWRWSDCVLWESDHRLSVFTEVISGTLEARIQLRGYVAAILGRQPTGIATIGGTGLAVATNE